MYIGIKINMNIKTKIIFCSLIMLMCQNISYSSDENSISNDSNISDDISSTTDDENNIKKRDYYLDELEKFKNEINENNFTHEERIKLSSVIEYAEKLCIKWDQTDSDVEHINEVIDTVTNIILKRIQDKIELRNKKQCEIVTDLINMCTKLKKDLSEMLVNQEDDINNIIM